MAGRESYSCLNEFRSPQQIFLEGSGDSRQGISTVRIRSRQGDRVSFRGAVSYWARPAVMHCALLLNWLA